MWTDNETEQDFLNFTGVAGTVAEIILQARGGPISIGVSGAWGVGKTSMIRLIRKAVSERAEADKKKFLFVDFNAWLYQGYDDARAALLDVIASKLAEEAEKRKTGVDKTKELLKRIDWIRTARMAVLPAVSLAFGVPPVGLAGDVWNLLRKVGAGDVGKDTIDVAGKIAEQVGSSMSSLLKPRDTASPPKEIQALRDSFEGALKELNITLVVLIDDLDRCLPATTISTLEAIRLFLFLERTAFVIAADNEMIKYAVRRHFDGVNDDNLITSYFDKLIQVPIRVPTLGTQEVRAYLMLLFVMNSDLEPEKKEKIRTEVCERLGQTWQGKRVDRAFLQTLGKLPEDLVARLDTADRLAPLMTKASGISGNPRLIKRFLNALSIRMAISRAQGVGVDEAVLAKMLLFERTGNQKAYTELSKAVSEDSGGKPRFLAHWEDDANAGKELKLAEPWNDPFVAEWLALPPRVADLDLRGVLYVSREHAPLITPEDQLSSESAELLSGLLQHPEMAGSLSAKVAKIAPAEKSIIMDRLLDRARQEQEWGVPDILEALLVVGSADPAQGLRVSAFLSEVPASQIKASIVPKIGDQPWAKSLFQRWDQGDVSIPVKKAIKALG
ncbi:MAG TPA: P-loop NTPase fold protein [Xanthobacteraceae bacterium]|nr:P-loop NTPase fold protein [Xanthobacteraceae bacterium]